MLDFKPGMYRLTKSMKNPYYETVSHRDLMGVLRVFPAGWDWVVHRNDNRERENHPETPPLMVVAACGGHCESMYVYEADYLELLAEHGLDVEANSGPPLLAPPEFLAALEPRVPDTLKRLKQFHKHSEDSLNLEDPRILDLLASQGNVNPTDVVEAARSIKKCEGEMYESYQAERMSDDQLYSDAVNEVFNETGEHWID